MNHCGHPPGHNQLLVVSLQLLVVSLQLLEWALGLLVSLQLYYWGGP